MHGPSSDRIDVSIVVPIRDAVADLPQLTRALSQQTLPAEHVELLMVDNGSADDTVPWLEANLPANARLLHSDHLHNAYAARNVGIRHARGPVVAFTDSDCHPEPEPYPIQTLIRTVRPWFLGSSFPSESARPAAQSSSASARSASRPSARARATRPATWMDIS